MDLAADVDDGADSDPEALDSDSEDDEEDLKIIMDSDETEGLPSLGPRPC